MSLFPDFEDSKNQIKMIGVGCPGSSLEFRDFPMYIATQAPELVLEGELSPKADIWSLGLLVCYQVFHLDRLANLVKIFNKLEYRSLFNIFDDHDPPEGPSIEKRMEAWVKVLGPLPQEWSHHYRPSDKFNLLSKRDSSS